MKWQSCQKSISLQRGLKCLRINNKLQSLIKPTESFTADTFPQTLMGTDFSLKQKWIKKL